MYGWMKSKSKRFLYKCVKSAFESWEWNILVVFFLKWDNEEKVLKKIFSKDESNKGNIIKVKFLKVKNHRQNVEKIVMIFRK